MSIYLKLEKQPKTIKSLIKSLHSVQPCEWDLTSVTTYHDSGCQIIECYEDKYRSIDDLIEIVQTYFPKASLNEIIENIVDCRIKKDGETFYPSLWHCHDINMPTLNFKTKTWANLDFEIEEDDEDQMDNSEFKDWSEVLSIIGIETFKEASKRLGHE